MPTAHSSVLIDSIKGASFLDESQLNELDQLASQHRTSEDLAADLIGRGWLTAWQLNLIKQGEGQRLRFGNYILLDLLGKGGMGEVYKARQRRLKRLVALKLIHADLLEESETVQRFHREAEAAARLDHPNIVRIYDADDVQGVHFLSMELVEGTDLSRLVRQSGPLPVGLACECVRQAALGLQHAHEQGLVHRDVKPGNLMLVSSSGTVKILDLGLARLGRGANVGEAALTMTQRNTPLGTPAYWAPEQALNAHGADIRADIYSLGCTLYHLLAGRPPFNSGNLPQLIAQHLSIEPEPVEQHRAALPPGLPEVVRKLMAKKPEDRYQTPGEAAKALEQWSAKADLRLATSAPAPSAPGALQSTAKPSATMANAWRSADQKPRARRGRWLVAALLLIAGGLGATALLAPERWEEAKRWVQGPPGPKPSEVAVAKPEETGQTKAGKAVLPTGLEIRPETPPPANQAAPPKVKEPPPPPPEPKVEFKPVLQPEESGKVRVPDVIYVPTPQSVVDEMLRLARVKSGDIVMDLGCGDGRIPIAAAKLGARGFGYDIQADLIKLSEENARKAGVASQVVFEQRDIFKLDLSRADVVTLYLLPTLNVKLIPQLRQMKPGTRIVSHDFDIQGVKPDTVRQLQAKDDAGNQREHRIYLWTVPLKEEGGALLPPPGK